MADLLQVIERLLHVIDESPGAAETADAVNAARRAVSTTARARGGDAVAFLRDLRLGVEMDARNMGDGEAKLRALDLAIAALSTPQPDADTLEAAIAAGDGTFHGAIDHWQERALRAEAALSAQGTAPAQEAIGDEPLTVRNAPVGTRAPAFDGGHWFRMKHGWKWNGPHGTGSTFPRPGGDWNGDLIPPQDDRKEPGA